MATHARRGSALLAVANTGPVVPLHQVSRLSRPFERLGTDRTRGRDGLELSIANAIAEAHGARICVRSFAAEGLEIQARWAPIWHRCVRDRRSRVYSAGMNRVMLGTELRKRAYG